jgi:chromatin remodeling complex protein RSC6
MESTAAGPDGMRLSAGEMSQAAAELLAQQSERRKRGRPPVSSAGSVAGGSMASSVDSGQPAEGAEGAEKKRKVATAVPTGGTVNVVAAKKAAAALIRESPTYKRLIDVEERIDLAIMRKQQDIKDALKTQSYTTTRTFRLYLFNTYRSQENWNGEEPVVTDSTTSDENANRTESVTTRESEDPVNATGDLPSWSLRIQGQLLPATVEVKETPVVSKMEECPVDQADPSEQAAHSSAGAMAPGDGSTPSVQVQTPKALPTSMEQTGQEPPQSMPPAPPPPYVPPVQARTESGTSHRFTDVFRKIVIELDRSMYADRNLIEWNRHEKEAPADGIELTRPGEKNCKVTVFLYVDHKPDRFKLSLTLARLVGVRQDTRSGVFMAVWQYIKKLKLQCVDDRTSIRVDSGLKTLMPASYLNLATIKLQQLFEVVKMHMGPPDPIQIEYNIKLSGNVVDNQDCYDIQVDLPDDGLKESAQSAGIFGLAYPNSAEFVALNDKHLEALEQVGYHKRRREFFESFCADPIGFINDLIMSQTRDLKVIAGTTGRNPEEERRSSYYQQQWVHEAIPRYLLRKAISDASRKVNENAGESR